VNTQFEKIAAVTNAATRIPDKRITVGPSTGKR
jgi:hypothetical protein